MRSQAQQLISAMRPLADDQVTTLPENMLAVRARASEVRLINEIYRTFFDPAQGPPGTNSSRTVLSLQHHCSGITFYHPEYRKILRASDIPVA